MPTLAPTSSPAQRPLAIAIVVGTHVLVFAAWYVLRSDEAPRLTSDDARMQWIWFKPIPLPAPRPPPRARVVENIAPSAPRHHVRTTAPMTLAPPAQPPVGAPVAAAAPTPASAADDPFSAPTKTAAERIVEKALHDVGKIDRELRRASPSQIHAPPNTPQTRLIAGIRSARVHKWDEPASIEEINAAGGGGKRMYKVSGPLGTYCATYDSNRGALDGADPSKGGPKITNCPH